MKSTELIEYAGISHRQLDNWVAAGLVYSSNGKHPGHGKAREFEEREGEVAKRTRLLMAVGFVSATAGRLARESLNTREITLAGPAWGLTLMHPWYCGPDYTVRRDDR
jgi:hypothetical protein